MMAQQLIAQQQICTIRRRREGFPRIEQSPEEGFERVGIKPRQAHASQLQSFAHDLLHSSEFSLGVTEPGVEPHATTQDAPRPSWRLRPLANTAIRADAATTKRNPFMLEERRVDALLIEPYSVGTGRAHNPTGLPLLHEAVHLIS